MKKWICLSLALVCLLAVFAVLPIHGEAGVYDNVIRLHVLANSDGEKDQALKLLVRDAVLAESRVLLDGVSTRSEAEEVLRGALPQIKEVAENALSGAGVSAPVEVVLGQEDYPRREYEALAFPAGEYLSLQVRIGAATGQNWWCVLFPPLCLSAATAENKTVCLSAGLTEGQYRMIAGADNTGYKLKFKLLEVAENWLK